MVEHYLNKTSFDQQNPSSLSQATHRNFDNVPNNWLSSLNSTQFPY